MIFSTFEQFQIFSLNASLIVFFAFYFSLLLIDTTTISHEKKMLICLFAIVFACLTSYFFPLNLSFVTVVPLQNLGFQTAISTLFTLIIAACTYLYSSRNWQVLYGSVAFSYIVVCIFFFFLETQSYYLVLATFFVLTCLLNSIIHLGGLISWSRFVTESYLKEKHSPLSMESFSKLWVNYLDVVYPVKKPLLAKGAITSINHCYTWVIFLYLLVLSFLTSVISFILLAFYLKAIVNWGPLSLYFLLHLFALHCLSFDPLWKENFESIFGKKALHRLGYNGPTISMLKHVDAQIVQTASGAIVAAAALDTAWSARHPKTSPVPAPVPTPVPTPGILDFSKILNGEKITIISGETVTGEKTVTIVREVPIEASTDEKPTQKS